MEKRFRIPRIPIRRSGCAGGISGNPSDKAGADMKLFTQEVLRVVLVDAAIWIASPRNFKYEEPREIFLFCFTDLNESTIELV
jgi:hypothetical protein